MCPPWRPRAVAQQAIERYAALRSGRRISQTNMSAVLEVLVIAARCL